MIRSYTVLIYGSGQLLVEYRKLDYGKVAKGSV